MADWAADFQWIVDRCKAEVSICVNEHRASYVTVDTFLDERGDTEDTDPDVLAEMKRLDRIVAVQAYPDTPVGFYLLYHHDIGAAVKRMRRILEEENDV